MARYKKYKMSSSPPHLTTCGLDFWYCKLIYNNCGLDFWYCKLIFKNWRKRVLMDHYGIFNTVQTDHQYQYLQCNIKWNKISMDQIFLSCFLLQRTSTSLFPVLLGSLDWWGRLSLPQCLHFSGKVSISFGHFLKSLIVFSCSKITEEGPIGTDELKPVMVYIHGGGYNGGFNIYWILYRHLLLQHNVQCTLIREFLYFCWWRIFYNIQSAVTVKQETPSLTKDLFRPGFP